VSLNTHLRALAKVAKTFSLEIGPLRARGLPAALVALGGVILAAGVTKVLAAQSERLPETLREARALTEAVRRDPARLNR
jgi:hypothetical protein